MKIFRKCLLALCLCATGTMLIGCGEAKLTEIYANDGSQTLTTITVDHNSTWSTDNFTIIGKLSNGETQTISKSDVQFSEINTAVLGDQTLTITYGAYEYKVTVKVQPVLSGIEIKGIKDVYKQNETMDLTATSIVKTLSDTTSTTINYADNLYQISSEGTAVVGANKKVTVTYENVAYYKYYEVIKTPESIVVSGMPDRVLYQENGYKLTDDILKNITAVVTYSDDSTQNLVAGELSLTVPNTNELGNDKEWSISFKDTKSNMTVEQTFEVDVYEEILNLYVNIDRESGDHPTAGYYVKSETPALDTAQFDITADFTKNKDVSINYADVQVSTLPNSETATGAYQITFTYQGVSSEPVTIMVVEDLSGVSSEALEVTKVEITNAPQSIVWGGILDKTAVKIKITYNNDPNLTALLTGASTGVTVTFNNQPEFNQGEVTTTSGITASYKEISTTQATNVTVNRVLSSIRLGDATTEYNWGASITYPKVYATYADSTTEFEVTATPSKLATEINQPAKTELVANATYANTAVTFTYVYDYLAAADCNKQSLTFKINDIISSIALVDFPTTCTAYDDLTADLKIKEIYVSGNEITYSYSALDAKYEVTENASAVTGDQEFKVTLISNTQIFTRATINVHGDYTAMAFSAPTFIAAYNKASATKNTYVNQGDAEGKVKGFYNTAEEIEYIYTIGDDNAFRFEPELQTDKGKTKDFPIKITSFKLFDTTLTTPAFVDAAYVDYIDLDKHNHTLTFNDRAVGKTFKMTIGLDYVLTATETQSFADSLVDLEEFTFKVIDGYNVYTAKELSIIDNVNEKLNGKTTGKWDAIKTSVWGADFANIQTKAVVLHNNIEITDADIPEEHFFMHSNGTAGDTNDDIKSFYDNSDTGVGAVYYRAITAEETFSIEVNFFTIDISELPKIREEGAKADEVLVTHTTLFYFNQKETAGGTYNITNTSFMGNAPVSTETAVGGLICYKVGNANLNMTNCLSQSWYISHFMEGYSDAAQSDTTPIIQTLNKVTSFDSYNTILYAWSAKNVEIEDSVMIGAGGPVMICDQNVVEGEVYNRTENDKLYISNIKTTNSTFQSWIVGSEPWFKGFGGGVAGTLVNNMKAALTGLRDAGYMQGNCLRNDGQQLNLIAVFKDGSKENLTVTHVSGSFTDTNSACPTGLDFDKYSPYSLDYIQGTLTDDGNGGYTTDMAAATMALQTFNGIQIDLTTQQPTALVTDFITSNDPAEQAQQVAARIAAEQNYLAAYLSLGMGVVLGFDKPAQQGE